MTREDWSPPLKVWHNGTEWVVAESEGAAAAWLVEHCGTSPEEADGEGWSLVPDEFKIKIGGAPYDTPRDVGVVVDWSEAGTWFEHIQDGRRIWAIEITYVEVEATAAEWIAHQDEPGVLCSTEF